MKDLKYYITPTVQAQLKKSFTKVFVYQRGKLIWEGSLDEYRPLANSRFKGMILETVVDTEAFEQHRKDVFEERARLANEFKADLFQEYNVKGHPKAETVFALAEMYSQSERDVGQEEHLESLVDVFGTLVELIK